MSRKQIDYIAGQEEDCYLNVELYDFDQLEQMLKQLQQEFGAEITEVTTGEDEIVVKIDSEKPISDWAERVRLALSEILEMGLQVSSGKLLD